MKQKVLITIFALFVFNSDSVWACQPIIQRHTKYFRQSKSVFVGKVVNVTLNDNNADQIFAYKIKFAIEKSWKGNKSEIEVFSDNGSPPCGQVKFRIGESYLVYVFKSDKDLYVSTYVGNRNRPLSYENDRNKKEFAELNSFWFRLKSSLWIF